SVDANLPAVRCGQVRGRGGPDEKPIARCDERTGAELREIGEEPRVEAVAEQAAERRGRRARRARRGFLDESLIARRLLPEERRRDKRRCKKTAARHSRRIRHVGHYPELSGLPDPPIARLTCPQQLQRRWKPSRYGVLRLVSATSSLARPCPVPSWSP